MRVWKWTTFSLPKPLCLIQCQVCPEGNAGPDYDIADGGTEQMWIDTDDTIYLYYTGPDSKSVFGVAMDA